MAVISGLLTILHSLLIVPVLHCVLKDDKSSSYVNSKSPHILIISGTPMTSGSVVSKHSNEMSSTTISGGNLSWISIVDQHIDRLPKLSKYVN